MEDLLRSAGWPVAVAVFALSLFVLVKPPIRWYTAPHAWPARLGCPRRWWGRRWCRLALPCRNWPPVSPPRCKAPGSSRWESHGFSDRQYQPRAGHGRAVWRDTHPPLRWGQGGGAAGGGFFAVVRDLHPVARRRGPGAVALGGGRACPRSSCGCICPAWRSSWPCSRILCSTGGAMSWPCVRARCWSRCTRCTWAETPLWHCGAGNKPAPPRYFARIHSASASINASDTGLGFR